MPQRVFVIASFVSRLGHGLQCQRVGADDLDDLEKQGHIGEHMSASLLYVVLAFLVAFFFTRLPNMREGKTCSVRCSSVLGPHVESHLGYGQLVTFTRLLLCVPWSQHTLLALSVQWNCDLAVWVSDGMFAAIDISDFMGRTLPSYVYM